MCEWRDPWAFVHGENSTRLRAPFEEPGKEAGDSGVLDGFTADFGNISFRREEVDGGLGGRTSNIDMLYENDQTPSLFVLEDTG